MIDKLDSRDKNEVISVLDLLDKYLGEELPPANWKLADFLIRSKIEMEQEDKLALIELVLESDWPEAVWLARQLIERGFRSDSGFVDLFHVAVFIWRIFQQTIYSEILEFAYSLGEQCKLFERYPDTAVLIQKNWRYQKSAACVGIFLGSNGSERAAWAKISHPEANIELS